MCVLPCLIQHVYQATTRCCYQVETLSRKRRMQSDIREFFSRTPATQTSITEEEEEETKMKGSDWMGGHPHHFRVKFKSTGPREFTVQCDRPQTVLQAIKSHGQAKSLELDDGKVVIQQGEGGDAPILPTHFPCTCIGDEKLLVVIIKPEKVEEAEDHCGSVLPKDYYCVFQISTKKKKYTAKREVFRSNCVKDHPFLSVYAAKGTTVAEALRKDGRFVGDLGSFTLSHFNEPNRITDSTEKVDVLHGGKFCIKITVKKKRESDEGVPGGNTQHTKCDTPAEQEIPPHMVRVRGVSVREVAQKSDVDEAELGRLLREQFPELKRLMEQRCRDKSYQSQVKLKQENFGKLQQSFSEVHKVRKLMKKAEAVCKVVVKDVCVGTGFVLFDRFIMTNAHLFEDCVDEGTLQDHIQVLAYFNYEAPEPDTDSFYFHAINTFIDIDFQLDYAVLELLPTAQKSNPQSKLKNTKMPPGLLQDFGPNPSSGEACIIGHLTGNVKRMDPTWIIEKEKRGQAIDNYLSPVKDHMYTLLSISSHLKHQGVDNILCGGRSADHVTTYNTFMYHGASGSPVFDSHCRVFGLHTAGFTYGFITEVNVIEYAHSLLLIFKMFVEKLKNGNHVGLLQRVEEIAQKNQNLRKILNSDPPPADELMDET